ncbi:uncharacterized protein LOC110635847 isoform X1 [Hevea brasiliensis]|uniref:uncharacterized protein LOC110635847 isoform X1 n=1 Tax=Hevea brasiliensis TaxID=3981 RepID=UPI0025D1F920|nr:uncharacterized protein LOC110635847 isoform X1 [Hevea brasiliensis]XP_057998968.1 uncharacterized protein LOC110635847 isoform X1 [Hevea brasiliensis]
MEPIEIGSRDEHLYDCYTLSHIEAVPSPSEGQTSQIQRKIKWVTLNPYGEVLQHVGSNRIKEHKDGNVSLPQNHMDDVVTSHILSDFESFDFELSDLLEEDVMGIEPGLVFFEDGSYSRGPVNIQVVDVDDSKKHIQPLKLTGSWKVFEVNATPVFGDEMVSGDSISAPYVYFCTETLKKRSLPENPIYFGEEEIIDM